MLYERFPDKLQFTQRNFPAIRLELTGKRKLIRLSVQYKKVLSCITFDLLFNEKFENPTSQVLAFSYQQHTELGY